MDSDSDPEAASMAALMGFSTFGSQAPPKKKRKFNAATDAFVDGQELLKLDRGGKRGLGSGGNTMPLGKTRVFGEKKRDGPAEGGEDGGKAEARNEDEIALDEENGEEEGGVRLDRQDGPRGRYERAIKTSPEDELGVRGSEEDDEIPSHFMDTSVPSISQVEDEEARKAQEKIDAILAASGQDTSDPLPISNPASTEAFAKPRDLPQRPAFTNWNGVGRGRGGSDTASIASSSRQSHGRREYNEKWYEGYYDPSFNENPWAALEKTNGLESKGSWIERDRRKG